MAGENLMIVQGGGPTPVLNASLASMITEGQSQSRIGKIFGSRSGMKGLSTGETFALNHLTPDDLRRIGSSPGAALGSSRFAPTEQDLARCVEHMRHLGVRHLVFIGGNGTMGGAQVMSDFCRSIHFDLQVVGVPKTIDNDIIGTDRCPGFGSAARYVAQSTCDLAADIQSLPAPVSIFETLGRDVGWLAASSVLAKVRPDDAPHLIYVPERPFSRELFLEDLDAIVRRIGWAVVVVSEGIRNADGSAVFEQKVISKLGSGNRPLIGGVAQYLSGVVAEHLGIRCRSEKPGFIGRSCMAQVSIQDKVDAELVGREAIRALLRGSTDVMLGLRSVSHQVGSAYSLIPLSLVAGRRRAIPAEWLSAGPLATTSSFREYVGPLVGDLCHYSGIDALRNSSAGSEIAT